MGQLLLLLVVALTVAAVVFGVTVLVSGGDPGLAPAEPDGRAVPLPADRPLVEGDVARLRFDTAVRGYRMGQVDEALRRAAYDIGYKQELIGVLEAEVTALREGRTSDADVLRRAREAAVEPGAVAAGLAGALTGADDQATGAPSPAAPPPDAPPPGGPRTAPPGVVIPPADDPGTVRLAGADPGTVRLAAEAPGTGQPAGDRSSTDVLFTATPPAATGADPTAPGADGPSGATRADGVPAERR